MSPSKLHPGPLNGHRPSPLQIKKESHLIHKSSSSSSTSNSSIITAPPHQQQQQQRNLPVIIYTHSPKVIHTQAKHFMALVQKLTGHSRSSSADNQETSPPPRTQQKQDQGPNDININTKPAVGHDDNDQSSSISTDENCHDQGVSSGGGGGDIVISPILKPPSNPYFAEVPLFTPTSTDFLCSLRPVFRYPDAVVPSPNMGNPISPSVFDFFKGLPEY